MQTVMHIYKTYICQNTDSYVYIKSYIYQNRDSYACIQKYLVKLQTVMYACKHSFAHNYILYSIETELK